MRTETGILRNGRTRLTFMVPEVVTARPQERPATSSAQKEQWPKHKVWHSGAQIHANVCTTRVLWHFEATTHITNKPITQRAVQVQQVPRTVKFPAFYQTPTVHYHVHKRPPLVSILNQIKSKPTPLNPFVTN